MINNLFGIEIFESKITLVKLAKYSFPKVQWLKLSISLISSVRQNFHNNLQKKRNLPIKIKKVKRISKNNFIEGEEKTDEMYENMLGYYFYEFTTSLSILPK
jgi:hypothetical protein